jgi:hypothetical protein
MRERSQTAQAFLTKQKVGLLWTLPPVVFPLQKESPVLVSIGGHFLEMSSIRTRGREEVLVRGRVSLKSTLALSAI